MIQQQKQMMAMMSPQYAATDPYEEVRSNNIFGAIIDPFRKMGRSLIQAVNPFSFNQNNHQFSIPMSRSQHQFADKKFDFQAGGSNSGSYGLPNPAPGPSPNYNVIPNPGPSPSYGTPNPVPGPSPTYGFPNPGPGPSPTYGVPSPGPVGGYGGNPAVSTGYGSLGGGELGKTFSVINSDSLPFFAGAALTTAIAAFSIASIAAGSQASLGRKKRSSKKEESYVLDMIIAYLTDNLHETLEEGFKELHSISKDRNCLHEMSCRALSTAMDEGELSYWEQRIDNTFEILNHKGEMRSEFKKLLNAAESHKCSQFNCVKSLEDLLLENTKNSSGFLQRTKRSTEDVEFYVMDLILAYVHDNYYETLEEGFEKMHHMTEDRPCLHEMSCRALSTAMNDGQLSYWEQRIDEAFAMLQHKGKMRSEFKTLLNAAESHKCSQFGCIKSLTNMIF